MQIRVKIDPQAAMRAGHDECGYRVISVNPADLSQDEREILAEAPDSATYRGGPSQPVADLYPDYSVAAATIEELRRVLSDKVAERRREADQRRQNEQAEVALLAEAEKNPEKWMIKGGHDGEIYPTSNSHVYIAARHLPTEAQDRFRALYNLLAQRRQREREQAEREHLSRCTAIIEQLERDPSPIIRNDRSGVDVGIDIGEGMKMSGLNVPAPLQARLQALKDRVEAQLTKEAKAKEAERRAQLHAWIAEHGTENDRERLAAGLLSTEEIRRRIVEWLFAPLAGQAAYERITSSDLESDDPPNDDCTSEEGGGYETHDMDCESGPAQHVDAETWERAKALRAKLPEGAVSTIKYHRCQCERRGCTASCERYGLLVELTWGPVTARREFAI